MDRLDLSQDSEDVLVFTVRNAYSFADRYFEGTSLFKKDDREKSNFSTKSTSPDPS